MRARSPSRRGVNWNFVLIMDLFLYLRSPSRRGVNWNSNGDNNDSLEAKKPLSQGRELKCEWGLDCPSIDWSPSRRGVNCHHYPLLKLLGLVEVEWKALAWFCGNNVTSSTIRFVALMLYSLHRFCSNNITSAIPKQRFYGKNEEKEAKKFVAMTWHPRGHCVWESLSI